jgi:hypothetical protein
MKMTFFPLLVAVKSTQNRQANMQCNFSKDIMILERREKYSFVVLVWYSPAVPQDKSIGYDVIILLSY